jgi:hypothetical protein
VVNRQAVKPVNLNSLSAFSSNFAKEPQLTTWRGASAPLFLFNLNRRDGSKVSAIILQGLKPRFLLAIVGTTEVMPCYKTAL